MAVSEAGEQQAAGSVSERALFLAVFPSIMLPMFLAAADQTIVATALPAIAGALGDVERISWVVVAYLIAATIAAPLFGRLGDMLGRKRMLFAALGVFVAASLLCALAASILALSFARVLQGLGGGGLMTSSQALIGETIPPRQRARYQGYLSATFVSSATFGPVAGGWLTQHFGWESVFLVNFPLGLIATGLATRLRAHQPRGGRLQFDVWGLFFFSGTVAPILLALEQAQRFDARALPLIGVLVAAAVASLAMLIRQEKRAPEPLLPVQLLRQAVIWRTDAMACMAGATIVSTITFLPIYLEVVRGTSPAETGFLILPLTAGISMGSLATGRLIAGTGRTAIFPSIGYGVAGVTLAVLAFLAPRLTNIQLPWAFAIASLNFGTAMTVAQITVQTMAGRRFLGAASGSVQFSRSVGAAFGAALVGAVLFATVAALDPQTAHIFTDLIENGPATLGSLDPARRTVVQAEIAEAFRYAFLTIAAFAFCGMGLAWSIPVRRL
ncbi:MAG: MFS transporter [Acetobacteraceae bacterium]|nr:MFS transporter [Acetobacteraceae bacterium]MBV8521258.1 MFS transporter [Acetobacteraceae bacterium]